MLKNPPYSGAVVLGIYRSVQDHLNRIDTQVLVYFQVHYYTDAGLVTEYMDFPTLADNKWFCLHPGLPDVVAAYHKDLAATQVAMAVTALARFDIDAEQEAEY